MTRPSDEALVERLQQGDTDALDALYQRYSKKLYVFCAYTLPAHLSLDPQDAVQEVFLRVIKGAATFKPQKASFRTWLFRIARNHCFDLMRRQRRFKFIPIGRGPKTGDELERTVPEEALVDPQTDLEKSAVQGALMEALRDCIEKLDKKDEKQAIILYYLGDKVYREIGEILGESTSMARNRVRAAQEKVKECLEHRGFHAVY